MTTSRIGVAQVDITPSWSGPTSGWGIGFSTAKATAPDEPLQRPQVTAVALCDADDRLVVLANIDIHGGSRPIWEGAAKKAGIEPAQLVLSGSHTHNGPGQPYGGLVFSLGSTTPLGLGRMRRHLIDRVGQAVRESIADLAPGGVAVVQGDVLDVGNNRATPAWKHYPEETITRFLTEGPGRSLADRERNAERYRDPRMTILVATDDRGEQRGVLGWYGVHPNSLGPRCHNYSADLYGWARARVARDLPATVVGFGGGAAGDISPLTLEDEGHLPPPHAAAVDVQSRELALACGERLGAATVDLVNRSKPAPFTLAQGYRDWKPTDTLPSPCYGMTQFAGGFDGPTSRWAELEEGVESERARSLVHRQFSLEGGQGPKIPWLYSITRVPVPLGWLFRLIIPNTLPLHVVRVDDHVFGTVPGEPTTMAGWRIEQDLLAHSPAATASVIGYAGDYCGYWVTPEEYLEQRYEAASTVFGRDSVPELCNQLAAMAAEAG